MPFCLLSDEFNRQSLFNTQVSSTPPRYTSDSFSSISISLDFDFISAIDPCQSDYSDNESDDDGYETVPSPSRAYLNESSPPIQPPSRLSTTSVSEDSSIDLSRDCADIGKESTSSVALNNTTNSINPIRLRALKSELSSFDLNSTNPVPVNLNGFYASEINRLNSFKKQNRDVFARLKVEELAYAGFYLDAEGTLVQCPWCTIKLTEQKFESILDERSHITGSPLDNEPWTAMCVHRQEILQRTNKDTPWCPWVRRETGGLYPNIMMV